jgi:hypothetical protein
MIKLQNLLAENMRRFNTKNLSEDLKLNAAAGFAEYILPKVQPGYDFETEFHTIKSAGTNEINVWQKTHLLIASSKQMALAYGNMGELGANGQKDNLVPTFAALNATGLARPLGALTMQSLLGYVMLYMDAAVVDKGLKTFIQQAKVPLPSQPLTAQSLQAIATKYKAVQQYNSMNTSLMAALGIK